MNGKMRAAPGDNVLPLSRAISYSHEQVTDQWMEWLESSFATCAFFNAPNRRPWFLSTGRLSFFARSLFSRSRDRDERGLASIFFFNRDIIRFANTRWCGGIIWNSCKNVCWKSNAGCEIFRKVAGKKSFWISQKKWIETFALQL